MISSLAISFMILSNLDERCSQTCEMVINDRRSVRRNFRYQYLDKRCSQTCEIRINGSQSILKIAVMSSSLSWESYPFDSRELTKLQSAISTALIESPTTRCFQAQNYVEHRLGHDP